MGLSHTMLLQQRFETPSFTSSCVSKAGIALPKTDEIRINTGLFNKNGGNAK